VRDNDVFKVNHLQFLDDTCSLLKRVGVIFTQWKLIFCFLKWFLGWRWTFIKVY